MKKFLLTLAINTFVFQFAIAQLSTPKVEGVYGGTISDIVGYAKSASTTRLFVATESANSVFYADFKTGTSSFVPDSFHVVKTLSSNAGFGSGIKFLSVHPNSGMLVFGHPNGLFFAHPDSSNVFKADNFNTEFVCLKDSIVIYLQGNHLNYKKISGTSILNSSIPDFVLGSSFSPQKVVVINPINLKVYILFGGNTPTLYKSSDNYNQLKSTTTFSVVSLSSLNTGVSWEGLGIAPDGRIFLGGFDFSTKKIAYSDNEVSWTQINTLIPGRGANRFSFAGASTSYITYFSSSFSLNKGNTWSSFGQVYNQTHPNDGNSYADPNDTNIVYLNTDAGLGVSTNRGPIVFDINTGIEALQVNGFSMTTDKKTAWLASKAGLRRVLNYGTGLQSWSQGIFPNGDGSPYYTVAIINNDSNRVYAGNNRIYKTNDGGKNWNQIFTPENPPFNFPGVGLFANKVAVAPFDTNIVMVTYAGQPSNLGGLFFSNNAGNTWGQIKLNGTGIGSDINLTDVVFTIESGDTIAYVSAELNSSIGSARSVYKIKKTGAIWLANKDMLPINTVSGIEIIAHITDLELNQTGDTLYAIGVDSSATNTNKVYFKAISNTNKWDTIPSFGLPFLPPGIFPKNKVSLGNDTLYAAINNTLYIHPMKDSIWFFGYNYPNGTQINFLYYDELLAGTGTGLYGHSASGPLCRPAYSTNITESICQGDSFLFNGQYIKQGGNYNILVKSKQGCDSVMVGLNLILNSRYDLFGTATICNGDIFMFPDGTFGDSTKTHISLLKSKGGCDSIVTITLTVNKPDVSILVNKDTLSSNSPNSTYQWLYCDSSFKAIPGATNKIFVPDFPGNYAVRVSKDNCTDTSSCQFINPSYLPEWDKNGWIKVFPNPSKELITIELPKEILFEISLIDAQGRTVMEKQNSKGNSYILNLSDLREGIYFIRLEDITNGHVLVKPVVKNK
ncbi:MAG: T9SS type A sorting domain-containing protein [Bacteroidia bacterium]|nr:T9SS type A sorting domain-containing protein [Bacteroidia bacterium]MCF8425450.1 T9SS type A sorting domain-containing protein [Bacteroidia bacterium]MCF8446268.1 T9SS type A sorting domain-containing protein [Bacteroidia bacterium]